MTQEELNLMETLNEKFQKECDHVAKVLTVLDDEYKYADSAWSLNHGTAQSHGDICSRGCYMETVYPEFDINLLTYTDEQLQEYIKQKQQEKDDEERRLKEDEEKREKQKDFQMFQHLKEKLGL